MESIFKTDLLNYIFIFMIFGLFIFIINKEVNSVEQNPIPIEPTNLTILTDQLDALSNQLALKKTSCNDNYYLDSCSGTLEGVLDNVHNLKEYKLGIWDCDQFTNEAIRQFKMTGYKYVKPHSVRVDCNEHMWNTPSCKSSGGLHTIGFIDDRIYFDATANKIIPPKDYALWGINDEI